MAKNATSRHDVELLGYSPEGVDAHGNVRHRMRWRDGRGSIVSVEKPR